MLAIACEGAENCEIFWFAYFLITQSMLLFSLAEIKSRTKLVGAAGFFWIPGRLRRRNGGVCTTSLANSDRRRLKDVPYPIGEA
jgi:hypothetical protein